MLINQKPHNQSTKNQTKLKTNCKKEEQSITNTNFKEKNPPKKEKRITRTGLLSGQLVNQDHNPNNMNGFRGNKEVVAIFDEKLESQQRGQH